MDNGATDGAGARRHLLHIFRPKPEKHTHDHPAQPQATAQARVVSQHRHQHHAFQRREHTAGQTGANPVGSYILSRQQSGDIHLGPLKIRCTHGRHRKCATIHTPAVLYFRRRPHRHPHRRTAHAQGARRGQGEDNI